MAKTSYFGGPGGPQMGANPSIQKHKIPYDISDVDFKLVLTDEQKEKENQRLIKDLVYHYERIGRQQLSYIREAILKKLNLANGVIDQADYIKGQTEYEAEIEFVGGESLDFDLKFYPIVPNIINTLTNYLSKIKIDFSAIALNREAQNEVIRQKNSQIQQLLISKAAEIYNADLAQKGITPETQPDVYQKQMEVFQALPQIQKYYSMDFRLLIEQWANHRIERDKRRFQFDSIEKKFFFNKLVTDRPYLHINLMGESYKPEVIRPENAFYIKSPYVDDVSEGVMFGWYDYESPVNLINLYGEKLDEKDIEKLQRFYLTTRFTQYTSEKYNTDVPDDLAIAQNYIAFKTEFRDRGDFKHRGEEYREQLVEVLHMYLQVPRKLYKLVMKTQGNVYSTLVSDDYKIDIKPIYQPGKPRTVDYLIEGEHLEPLFINELWRCVKINLTRNPNPDLGDDIWVVLDKYPVQISNPRISQFGSIIPVHGGPKTNEYSPSASIVDKCAPWQVFYNYLWNRNNQILQSEIGTFLMMNQNAIPQESMGEEWGKSNVIKWMLAARDIGIAPTDNSILNTGQSALNASGGFGQVVDLTRTNEVIEKAKLAEICKQECLAIVGISPQLLGDISPNETATGIVQGAQRSITQLKHLYDEHYATLELAWQTLLEIAKYVSINYPKVEESYVTDEGERVIFQTETENFPLYQLGVFITASLDDNILSEEIKQLALKDNTLDADSLDKLVMLSSKSVSQTYAKLKELRNEKDEKIKQEQQYQMQMQQQQIEARQMELDKTLERQSIEKQLDRESQERIAEFKVIGAAQLSEGGGVEELTKLKELQLKEDSYYQSIIERAEQRTLKSQELALKQADSSASAKDQMDIKKQELALKREEILAKLKISKDNLKIAQTNPG